MMFAQFFARSSLVGCTSLLLVSLASPASAITFDLNEISASNIGTGSQGLVTLTPDALDPKHKTVEVLDGHYNDLLTTLRGGGVDILYGVLRLPKWAFDVEEKFLFSNRYAVVARRDHPLPAFSKITISQLSRYDWIMPPPGTPRRHAFEEIIKGHKSRPKVSVETTSMGVYGALLGTSDRLSLFSDRDVKEYRAAGIEALPYHSPKFQRDDGKIAFSGDLLKSPVYKDFAGDLNGRLAKGIKPVIRDRGADHAFPADDTRLDQIAVLHHGEQRYHATERKVDMLDRSRGRVQHRAPLHRHTFEIGLKDGEIVGAKLLYETVFPDRGRLRHSVLQALPGGQRPQWGSAACRTAPVAETRTLIIATLGSIGNARQRESDVS